MHFFKHFFLHFLSSAIVATEEQQDLQSFLELPVAHCPLIAAEHKSDDIETGEPLLVLLDEVLLDEVDEPDIELPPAEPEEAFSNVQRVLFTSKFSDPIKSTATSVLPGDEIIILKLATSVLPSGLTPRLFWKGKV